MLYQDYGDKGRLTLEERYSRIKQINADLTKENNALRKEIKTQAAELAASQYAEETYRRWLENGQASSLLIRLYWAIFAPREWGVSTRFVVGGEMRYSLGKVFHIVSRDGRGWFRIFGIGISWKDTRRHRLVFSERQCYRRGMQVSKWRLHFLSREKDLTNEEKSV